MLINIIGKPGTGKSTLMVNLACALAKSGRKIAIMSTDMTYQSVQYYFSNTKIGSEQSLGLMFQKKDVRRPERYFVRAQGYGDVYVAGISGGEASLKYDLPEKEDVNIFLDELKSSFDFVFIENAENIASRLSYLSLIKSDVILDIIDLSLQGISYKLSVRDILQNIGVNKQIISMTAPDKYLKNKSRAEIALGLKFDFQIPHCPVATTCANSGMPIIYASAGEGRVRFVKFIESLRHMLEMEACGSKVPYGVK